MALNIISRALEVLPHLSSIMSLYPLLDNFCIPLVALEGMRGVGTFVTITGKDPLGRKFHLAILVVCLTYPQVLVGKLLSFPSLRHVGCSI